MGFNTNSELDYVGLIKKKRNDGETYFVKDKRWYDVHNILDLEKYNKYYGKNFKDGQD